MATVQGVVVEISANIAKMADGINSSIRLLNNLDKTTQTVSKSIDRQTSFLKSSWMNVAGAIYTVQSVSYMFERAFSLTIGKALSAVNDFKLGVAQAGAVIMQFSEPPKNGGLEEHFRQSLEYAKEMYPVLEKIAAETLLSGQETQMMFTEFAKGGVILDATNKKAVEGFKTMSNTVAIMTQGQDRQRQILTEIKALMQGQANAGSVIFKMLESIDPKLKEHLKIWKSEGTLLEHMGELLQGFNAFTGELAHTWDAVKTRLETTVNQVLRGGMIDAYDEIMKSIIKIDDLLQDNKEILQNEIYKAWISIKGVAESLNIILGTINQTLMEMVGNMEDGENSLQTITKGWAIIASVYIPGIADDIKSIFISGKHLAEAFADAWMAAGSALSGQFGNAKAWIDEMNQSYSRFIHEYGKESSIDKRMEKFMYDQYMKPWDNILNKKIKPSISKSFEDDAKKASDILKKFLSDSKNEIQNAYRLLEEEFYPLKTYADMIAPKIRNAYELLEDEFIGGTRRMNTAMVEAMKQVEYEMFSASKEMATAINIAFRQLEYDIAEPTKENDFFQGLRQGAYEYIDSLKYNFERGEDLARESFTSMENFFTDLFVGKVKLTWENLLGWMGSLFAKFMSQLTTELIAQTGLIQKLLSVIPGVGSVAGMGGGLMSLIPGVGTLLGGAMLGGAGGYGMMGGGALGLLTGMGGFGGGSFLAGLGGMGGLGASIASFLATSAFAIPIVGAIGAGIGLLVDSLLGDETIQQKFRVVGGELHTYGDMSKKKEEELLANLQPLYDAFVEMSDKLGLEAGKLFDIGRWGLEDQEKITGKELMNSFYRGLLDALDQDTEMFKEFQKEGEKYYETIQRVMYAFAEGIPRVVKSIDAYISAIENSDDTMALYIDQLNQAEQNIHDLQDALESATDPSDAIGYAEQLKQAIYDKYIYEKELIEGLVESISQLEMALADFTMDIQKKINELAGGNNIEMLFDAFNDAFLNAVAPGNKANALDYLKKGIAYLDEWVNENITAIEQFYDVQRDALQGQIDTLNSQITALQDSKEAINDQIDALQEQISLSKEWENVLDSVKDQILDMKTSLDNPRDIFERMGVAYGELQSMLGMYQSATGEDKAKYASELQSLISTYLGMAQEAYQRPSPEYQAIYTEMLNLLGMIQGDAESYAGTQEDYLRQISELQAQSTDIDTQIVAYQQQIADLQQQMADLDIQMADDIQTFKNEALDYYEWAKEEGIRIYQESISDMKDTLAGIIGDKTVEEYLADLQLAAVTELAKIRQLLTDLLLKTFPEAELPQMASGGITTRAIKAQLHANEAVIPLDRSGAFGVTIGDININTSGNVNSQDLANTIENTIIHSIKYGKTRKVVKEVYAYGG